MSELTIFKNEQFGEIRTVLIDGEPWFIAKDICDKLELGNVTMSLERLSENQKLISTLLISGQNREVNVISESGLYKLVFTSRKPEAEKFTDWITSEVIPSIRKHGIYATDNFVEKALSDPDYMIEILLKFKEERTRRIEAEKTNAILMHVSKLYTTTEIAKELNLKSANELNKLLHEKDIQYKQNKTWMLYSKYSNLGYEEIKQEVLDNGKIIYHRKWTQIGREFILKTIPKGEKSE